MIEIMTKLLICPFIEFLNIWKEQRFDPLRVFCGLFNSVATFCHRNTEKLRTLTHLSVFLRDLCTSVVIYCQGDPGKNAEDKHSFNRLLPAHQTPVYFQETLSSRRSFQTHCPSLADLS